MLQPDPGPSHVSEEQKGTVTTKIVENQEQSEAAWLK